jgi:hypothetical protein
MLKAERLTSILEPAAAVVAPNDGVTVEELHAKLSRILQGALS